jgi:phosphatidylserine/phosphatidylglycerophosphate/cardiolipin synthase-like enzyme
VTAFQDAVAAILGRVSTNTLESVARSVEAGEAVESAMGGLGSVAAAVTPLFDALAAKRLPPREAAAYLRGAAAGYHVREQEQTVEVVWSGPRTHDVPTRSTAEVLKGLIDRAEGELILVTYSAREYEPIVTALAIAAARGVEVTIVVETLQGAAGAIVGREPAAAFANLPGASLWNWPSELRAQPGSKMHAKIAIADRRELFSSSVNLTASGVKHSIESGVLVRGGSAPVRAAEHIRALQAAGILRPLSQSTRLGPEYRGSGDANT